MNEQRKTQRIPVRLEVQWNGVTTRSPDVASDLSLGGCFVESLNSVSKGDILNLEFCLPSSMPFRFSGEVRYHQPNIGFGVKFLELSAFQRQTLRSLITSCGNSAFAACAA